MESLNKLSTRGRFVRGLLMAWVVVIACLSYFAAVYFEYRANYSSAWQLFSSRDMLLTFLLISMIWIATDAMLKLNEVYRSRPYSYILILHALENVIGVIVLLFAMVIFGIPNYGRSVLIMFGTLSFTLSFLSKVLFYHYLRRFRKRGRNARRVVFVADKAGERLMAQIMRHYDGDTR